jgi:putative transposase
MSLLACVSPEEEYHQNVCICSSSKGGIYTVHGILLFIKRLTSLCFQSLHHHYIHWTKPGTARSLMVGALTDLARSKSELVAENALLRQQLIILRRHVKRPVCDKTDRMLLVFWQEWFEPGNRPTSLVQPETLL